MTTPSNSIFVVGVPDSDPAPQQRLTHQPTTWNRMTAPQPREVQPTHFPTTPTPTTMTLRYQTQQEIDAQTLRELTTINTNQAVAALKTNPVEAAAALRAALGYAERFNALNAELAVNSARQVNEFHGYDVNNPMAGSQRAFVPNGGGYDLNNPEGV